MNKNRFDKQVKVVDDILVKSSQVKSSQVKSSQVKFLHASLALVYGSVKRLFALAASRRLILKGAFNG